MFYTDHVFCFNSISSISFEFSSFLELDATSFGYLEKSIMKCYRIRFHLNEFFPSFFIFLSHRLAAVNGNSRIALVLLQNGANINAVDKDGWTSLHLASRYDKDAVMKFEFN